MLKQNSKPAILLLAILLSACGNIKENLGITKDAPDEFSVVKHEPLEMPTNVVLPPPRPGMPRPQEQATTQQAKNVVFGQNADQTNSSATASGAESVLLQKTGAANSDPNIRNTIDAESEEYAQKNTPVAQKLLGLSTNKKAVNTTETLNPKLESERLKQRNLPTTELPPDWDKKENTEE